MIATIRKLAVLLIMAMLGGCSLFTGARLRHAPRSITNGRVSTLLPAPPSGPRAPLRARQVALV